MKAYTSRERFDERRRFTGVRERMGQVRLDSDANEQVVLSRTDARRRSGDVADGSPDDGFSISDLHLLDPITSATGWSVTGLAPSDERVITPELGLARRDPETLPHVMRSRGHTRLVRLLPTPVDLLRLPIPLAGGEYAAGAIVMQVRFEQDLTDDEITDVRVVVRDGFGAEHDVATIDDRSRTWTRVRVPIAALAPLRAGAPGAETMRLAGWGLRGLPPRASVMVDALLVEDTGLGDDVVVRGGDGTIAGAGRIYRQGYRAFIESDWRYSRQPDLPDPEPILRPAAPVDPQEARPHHVCHLDIFERTIHPFQDGFLAEPALGGDETGFRTRKVVQVRAVEVPDGGSEALLSPTGGGLLTTNVADGERPDRYPTEEPDPCRDRCLFTENLSTGDGYLGQHNVNVRIEVLATHLAHPVVGWSRDNASVVAPLVTPAIAGGHLVYVDPSMAERFSAGDHVVIEDERSRLDGARQVHRADIRRLRAVNAATGELELEPAGTVAATAPADLQVGGPLSRSFLPDDAAAVRRWDGVDWLLLDVRYNLIDGITFAFDGDDFRLDEYWVFTARVIDPDGSARGVVEQLVREPVAGPWHERAPLARIVWTDVERRIVDLRARFLPLHEVRQRLIELGRRELSPGAFTVVVGDGVDTFGDIDQNLAEGVTGDEAIQAAVNRLAELQVRGGTVYVRAGNYVLEHPVLVRGRSAVSIIGDGDASFLRVTGAGGAFYLDWCGHAGAVSIESLRLEESPAEETPFGTDVLVGDVPLTPLTPLAPGVAIRRLQPADLIAAAPVVPDLLDRFAASLRDLRSFEGRAAESVVATIVRLRRLQRERPGRPLEEVAPDELAVLRRLPHGVVTVADSSRVRLADLSISSREEGRSGGVVAAGVLITGSCVDVSVGRSRISAAAGVVAAPYGNALTPLALVLRPRSGLHVRELRVNDNQIDALGDGTFGVRVADGVVDGLTVRGNRVTGFRVGISFEDQTETRAGAPVDRSTVADNLVVGSRRVGVLISGDGVDIDANEVRLGQPGDDVGVGVLVTGSANRVRDCWVTIPEGQPRALGVQAGIVVGSGLVGTELVTRPVVDIEVAGNRVDGTGALATGILVGGSQPVYDVRVVGNTLRNLGDAGVRAWANAGPVGGLRIEENTIEGVARAYPVWGAATVAALRTLAGDVAIPAQATPRVALDVLLGVATDVSVALDAVLRFLEYATLRGGIVLSLVEESGVRRNQIVDVGTKVLPPGFAGVDGAPTTAGIAVAGGRDLVIDANVVRRVQAPVQVVVPPIRPRLPIRPPIFDRFRELVITAPGRTGSIGADIHGAAVALRREVLDYAAGNARVRQRIGGRVYAATESLAGALESAGGPERGRLVAELVGGLAGMQEAQGFVDHTTAANHLRATLSRIAALTASDESVTEAWMAAAKLDDALLGDDADVVAVASDLLSTAGDLEAGLETLGLDLASKAEVVVGAAGGDAVRTRNRLALAAAVGRIGEARANVATSSKALGSDALVAGDRAVAEGVVRLSLGVLDTPDASDLNEEALAGIDRGAEALGEVLRVANPALADRVRRDISVLRDRSGAVVPEEVERLRETLTTVGKFAAGEEVPAVSDADVDSQAARFQAELIALTADQLERRVAGLASDPEAAAQRNLRVLHGSVGQLANRVGGDRRLQALAADAHRAIGDAIADPANRRTHEETARRLLRSIQEAQASAFGAPVGAIGEAATRGNASTSELDAQLAGVGELLLTVRDLVDADLREEGVGLVETGLRSVVDAAGLSGTERDQLMTIIGEASAVMRSPAGPASKQGAVHRLAAVAETVSFRAAQDPAATPEVRAVHVVNGALARALDVGRPEADRLRSVGDFVGGRGDSLSGSLLASLTGAADIGGVLSGARTALADLVGVRPVFFPPQATARFEAHPADGLYVTGVERQLQVRSNDIEEAAKGATIVGRSAHVLAPRTADSELALTVESNRVNGGVLGGFDLRPEGVVSLAVDGNQLTGCVGAGPNPEPEAGTAVVRIAGTGELVVSANRLRNNGNRRAGGVVHELHVDWRGDVTLRDNVVRHGGGAAGGAAVVVTIGGVPAALVRSLSSQPALVVEPPDPGRPPVVGPTIVPNLPDWVAAGLGAGTAALAGGDSFAVGALRMTTRELRPTIALLQTTVEEPPDVGLAEARADRWFDIARADRFHPLLDFLDRRPPPIIALRPRVRRAVHVSGNDLVAFGPALLLLVGGNDLVSATVVANELESSAATGAVYLRNVDTTVFSSNRCECLADVNVAVVRPRRSLVSVMGNVAIGAEPPAPPKPPFVPIRPGRFQLGDVHLAVKTGVDSALTLRLDEGALLTAMNERKQTTFAAVAEEAEATYGVFAKRQRISPQMEARAAVAAPHARFTIAGQPLAPELRLDDTPDLAEPVAGVLQRVVADSNQILADRSLSASAKLYGVAVAGGLAPPQARALVQSQLVLSSGNEEAALASGLGFVTGGSDAGPTVAELVRGTRPVEDLIALLLRDRNFEPIRPIGPIRPIAPPRPPRPPRQEHRLHSVVVVGGSRVGAINNVTTAGVLVIDAAHSIENNL